MKQEDFSIRQMSSADSPNTGAISPEYLELHLALCAGERDLEQRRKSVPRSSLAQPGRDGQPLQRSRQQRTHSCKYPSETRRVTQPSRARNGSPGCAPTGYDKPSPRGADDKDGSSGSSPRSLSAPQSRSSSWKKMRRPKDVRHFREVYGCAGNGCGDRERGSPSPRSGGGYESLEETIVSKLHELKLLQDEDCCVVRSFSTSPRGIINRGDSFKRKSDALVGPIPPSQDAPSSGDVLLVPVHPSSRPHSWNPRHSACSEEDGGAAHIENGEEEGEDDDVMGDRVVPPPPQSVSESGLPSYTVLVMGDHGVGKTALLQQFMTSDFMAAIETTFDMECEKTVSVLLDGQETILNFVDLPISVQKECVQYAEIEAYLITYSITERQSFTYAANILQELRHQGRSDAAVILVANKNDLVRSRQVSEEEGKCLCDRFNCKYIEVSAALNHRVDELLVGLVQQIRLNPHRLEVKDVSVVDLGRRTGSKHSAGCLNAAVAFVVELIRKRRSTSRSCDDLWVI